MSQTRITKGILFVLLFLLPALHPVVGQTREADIEKKVSDLLHKMTLEEKVGQMLNLGLPVLFNDGYWAARDTAIVDTSRLAYFFGRYGAGSIHNTPGYPPLNKEWHRLVKQIQDYALKHTRLGIPVIYGIDDIHGANYVMGSTLMPHEIALAATWNPQWAFKAGEITSYESRSASLPWNYNPNADVATQPLWGRIGESFGEDPYLISRMVEAYTHGSQNGGLANKNSTAVCIKHFMGYGAGINGKDRASAIIPENYLRQYYLPPFKAAIDAGAMTIMLSSNSVNGIPCHINKFYITDIIKGELGFKGFTISDFSDVEFLYSTHQVASDMAEATEMAINAGLDMVMNPYDAKIVDIIIGLVKQGRIPLSRIDDAVTRILRVKFALNLFQVPYNEPSEYPRFASAEFQNDNYNSACEAITLLKNQHILPLSQNKKVFVTGYAANSINQLNGAWSRSFQGQSTKFNDPSKQSILDAIKNQVGADNVTFVEGTDYLKDINSDEAVTKAKDADYIVACIGEMPSSEKPSDINELPIPEVQQELIKKLSKTGKPIILVLVEGRPRIIKDIEPLAQGILMAYLPGDEGGRAVADILYGKVNPSGKLPYTYPKYTGNILPYYHKKVDIRDVNWGFNGFYPQYEFGFGLSYTTFEYSNLKLSTSNLSGNQELTISIDVKNTGKIAGKEAVECYTQDLVASISPDVMKLVRFSKIELKPGESQTVTFTINKADLAFVGMDNKWITEPGKFKVFVGGNPQALKEAEFNWSK